MRSTSRPSKHPRKYPDHYDDPLGMDEISSGGTRLQPTAPVVVTGLSDEEDARRHVAKEFDKSLRFCTNCEGYYDVTHLEYHWCPYCGGNLYPVGTKASRRKFEMR